MLTVGAAALLLALVVDHQWGEPSARFHPVVWMGAYLGWVSPWVAPAVGENGVGDNTVDDHPGKHFWLGVGAWCAGAALVWAAAWVVQDNILWLPQSLPDAYRGSAFVASGLSALLLGLALKPLLAWRMLRNEVQGVEKALGESLQAGRERLGWLVSRDVSALTEVQVRESAIESLAENLNDSVVAPIFWFVLLGLPGAALYRFANTADAMWGYRGVRNGRVWEWGGKWAAWADDVLSWVPARITAVLLALVAGGVPLAALPREAARTPSPNSGWPMAAMALALDVCLRKPGVYDLNAPGREPQASDTFVAIMHAKKVVIVLIIIAQIAILFIASGGLI